MRMFMKLLARLFLFFILLSAGRLWAQVAGPSPLVNEQTTAQNVPGGWIVAEGRANMALQTGFPATAAGIYHELLQDSALPSETRQRVTLSLVSALMDAGDVA